MALNRIGKRFAFEAAHSLPEHDGKCRRPHGHSYRVEVTVVGEPMTVGAKSGMVVDFGDVSEVWKRRCEPLLDHRDLNESLVGVPVTTAEWIARWLFELFASELVGVERVRVFETASSFAEFPAS